MELPSVTGALRAGLPPDPGELVYVTLIGRIVSADDGYGGLHIQVLEARSAGMSSGKNWAECFVLGREPVATIKDWIG